MRIITQLTWNKKSTTQRTYYYIESIDKSITSAVLPGPGITYQINLGMFYSLLNTCLIHVYNHTLRLFYTSLVHIMNPYVYIFKSDVCRIKFSLKFVISGLDDRMYDVDNSVNFKSFK